MTSLSSGRLSRESVFSRFYKDDMLPFLLDLNILCYECISGIMTLFGSNLNLVYHVYLRWMDEHCTGYNTSEVSSLFLTVMAILPILAPDGVLVSP
jgi:hypothetical protein